MQAASIMLFITFTLARKAIPLPVVIATFIGVTILCCVVGTTLSIYLSTRWTFISGPAVGMFVGLIASCLTLSPSANFSRLMFASFATSTLLIVLSCWQGRFLEQEEYI